VKQGNGPAGPGIGLAVVAAAGLLAVSACQTGPVDAGGRGMQLTEWRGVEVSELDLTYPLLMTATVTKAEYRGRDNVISEHRVQLDGGKGSVTTERVMTSWFGLKTEKDLQDVEDFKKSVADFLKDDLVGFGDIRPVRHAGKRSIGFAAVVDVKDPAKGKCLFARVGYRLRGSTHYDNDGRNVDTAMHFRYCDPDVRFEDFARVLETVDRVDDRAAFAAALAAR